MKCKRDPRFLGPRKLESKTKMSILYSLVLGLDLEGYPQWVTLTFNVWLGEITLQC